jgi:hypothetical protein
MRATIFRSKGNDERMFSRVMHQPYVAGAKPYQPRQNGQPSRSKGVSARRKPDFALGDIADAITGKAAAFHEMQFLCSRLTPAALDFRIVVVDSLFNLRRRFGFVQGRLSPCRGCAGQNQVPTIADVIGTRGIDTGSRTRPSGTRSTVDGESPGSSRHQLKHAISQATHVR